MASKRKTLGRGLDALLGTQQGVEVEARAGSAAEDGELRQLPVELLQRGRYQPRIDMRTETLQELAQSIAAQGVVQPLVVRPITPTASGARFEIIAGERRWRAAQLAGLAEIPVLIKDVPDDAAMAMSLIENIQREDLNPLEEAAALQRLIEEFGLTHQAAAEAIGRSRAAVTNLLRLLDLGDEVKGMVERRELEMGHARALLALSPRQQGEAARQIVRHGLTVRGAEQLVRRLQRGDGEQRQSPAAGTADPDVRRLEADLADKLGARVSLRHQANGNGRLVIRYHSLDELEGILGRIH